MARPNKQSKQALFIGAHPDDIEIGAGGIVAKLVKKGWHVSYFILTSEKDVVIANKRKTEAMDAASMLGVKEQDVHFFDFPDTYLKCNGKSITAIRNKLTALRLDPVMVFTHGLSADSHNDHRAANQITTSAFRKKLILCYGVVNSLIESEFAPRFLIDITAQFSLKKRSMRKFVSQMKHGRIMNDALNHFNSKFLGQRKRCEAFELIVQSGGEKCLEEALALNDSPFYRFWFPLLRDGKAVLMHSVPIYRRSKKFDWPSDKEQDGIWHLQRAFEKMWEGQNPIEQLSSSTPHIEQQLYSSNIIITGSTASNVIARTYFEHFKGLRYGTNYFMPDYTDIHIYDRQKRKKIYSRYAKDDFGGVSPVRDYGILTVIKNPMDDTKFLIGCMGNHGFGTLGCLETISTSECLNALLKLIGFPLKGKGFQILVEHNIADHEAKIIKSSLHLIS